jgi:hypothetical protein
MNRTSVRTCCCRVGKKRLCTYAWGGRTGGVHNYTTGMAGAEWEECGGLARPANAHTAK